MASSGDNSPEIRIVGIPGSLRPQSITRLAVSFALRGAVDEGAKARLLDLRTYDLPFWGRESEVGARAVKRFHSDLRAADGIILGSPELHGSLSGVLKNALDLTGSDEFEGKMVGLVGVAGGKVGAGETLTQLRTIGRSLHAWVVPNQVSIGNSEEAFNPQGEPYDSEVGTRLKEMGRQVAHFARLHKCEAHLQFIKEWEGLPTRDVVEATAVPAK